MRESNNIIIITHEWESKKKPRPQNARQIYIACSLNGRHHPHKSEITQSAKFRNIRFQSHPIFLINFESRARKLSEKCWVQTKTWKFQRKPTDGWMSEGVQRWLKKRVAFLLIGLQKHHPNKIDNLWKEDIKRAGNKPSHSTYYILCIIRLTHARKKAGLFPFRSNEWILINRNERVNTFMYI